MPAEGPDREDGSPGIDEREPVTRLDANEPGGRGMVVGGLALIALIVVGLGCMGTLLARYLLPV